MDDQEKGPGHEDEGAKAGEGANQVEEGLQIAKGAFEGPSIHGSLAKNENHQLPLAPPPPKEPPPAEKPPPPPPPPPHDPPPPPQEPPPECQPPPPT